jgi:hypothetical protein
MKSSFWMTVTILFFWAVGCFISWKITAPWQWIVDIPTYSADIRFMIICLWFFWHFLFVSISHVEKVQQ